MSAKTKLFLSNSNPKILTIFATLAAFSIYTSMYAFRKAFSVAEFENITFFGIDYKMILISAQIIGYTISKFIGIKIVAEITSKNRGKLILILTLISGFSLFLFAVIPQPYNIICLFLNGLPIGMIFGLVYTYLEGRKITEILVLGLSLAMIVSSGFIKSIGKLILSFGVSEFWMPFVVVLTFLPLLLLAVWMLNQIPEPSEEDVEKRTKRNPMNKAERKRFLREFKLGLIFFLLAYTILTMFRDFRDNFSVEIWKDLGFGDNISIYSQTEIPIGIAVVIVMTSLKWIKNNTKAFYVIHLVSIVGAMSIGISTYLFELQIISPFLWMTLLGLGLYISYIPANTIFFERLISSFKYISTAGFMVTLADFYGYFGSVGILFYKNFGNSQMSYLSFFKSASYIISFAVSFLFILSFLYFYTKVRSQNQSSNK
jgi:MFS family permease